MTYRSSIKRGVLLACSPPGCSSAQPIRVGLPTTLASVLEHREDTSHTRREGSLLDTRKGRASVPDIKWLSVCGIWREESEDRGQAGGG